LRHWFSFGGNVSTLTMTFGAVAIVIGQHFGFSGDVRHFAIASTEADMALTCDVCNDFLLDNLNASGIIGRYGTVTTLYTLHHAVAADVMARHGKVNWRALAWATIRLSQIRPNAMKEPDRWAEFMPVDRLNEIYEDEIAQDPSDWPPYEGDASDDDPYFYR
jgi:hypothetical protein